MAAMPSVDPESSFAQFVYPFVFAGDNFEDRAASIRNAQWAGRERPLTVWQKQSFPESDLLTHVARFLNSPPETPATAHMWCMDHNALRSSNGLAGNCDWQVQVPGRTIGFGIEMVQLVLFRIGVGFLTIRAQPSSAELATWLDFVHYFRFASGRGGVSLRCRRQVGKEQTQAFFPEVAGALDAHPDGTGVVVDLIEALLATGGGATDTQPWWRDIFVPGQLLPYTGVFVENADPDQSPRLVYGLRNFFHSRQELRPTEAELDLERQASVLPYVAGQWFLFSLAGGAFVACDAPREPFFRQTLPDHLQSDYFLVFLIALHQRFTLMMISDEVAKHWLPNSLGPHRDELRELAFERMRDTLLSFTARGYFAQVMQLEHHHRCYLKWQETFQLERLYAEVRDEVRDMHEHLLMQQGEQIKRVTEERDRRTKRFERRISQGALLIGVPGVVAQYLGVTSQIHNLQGPQAWTTAAKIGLGLGVAAALILTVLILQYLISVRNDRPVELKAQQQTP